jgi:hypothetical protein
MLPPMARRAADIARLAAWLGPWAGTRVPKSTTRTPIVIGDARPTRAYVYRPRRAHGVYLVAPGLHYPGPDDPRMDRFCRVLANAGHVVVAPFLSDFLALRIAETTTADLARAFDHACAIAEAERLEGPAVFSISFGSRPAIELCASEAGARATKLVLFGGFCDFDATVRFAVTGRASSEGASIHVPHDPLNAPVVFLNLLAFHDDDALDKPLLARAMREMVQSTWGRPELKIGDRRAEHASKIVAALSLSTAEREFFLRDARVDPELRHRPSQVHDAARLVECERGAAQHGVRGVPEQADPAAAHAYQV